MKQLINHVAFVIDASGSMKSHRRRVPEMLKSQLESLAEASKKEDQKTRVSVYTFNSDFSGKARIVQQYYDVAVARAVKMPISYDPDGGTPLIDATIKAIQDLKYIPELFGDHGFLVYVLTDGDENRSVNAKRALKALLGGLPENWTVVAQVPDRVGKDFAIAVGFQDGNVQVWEASTERGFEEARVSTQTAMRSFTALRSSGIRGSSNFYAPDLTKLTKTTVNKELDAMKLGVDYTVLPVRSNDLKTGKPYQIKTFVEQWLARPYGPGTCYYELTKPETVQGYKQIVLQDKVTGKTYSGTEGRRLLGLPDYELKISPGDHGKWRIFVQSTSSNRNLVAGTQLVVML